MGSFPKSNESQKNNASFTSWHYLARVNPSGQCDNQDFWGKLVFTIGRSFCSDPEVNKTFSTFLGFWWNPPGTFHSINQWFEIDRNWWIIFDQVLHLQVAYRLQRWWQCSSGLGKLRVGWRHLHGLGVDEGEEEDVGAVLLILVQPRLPNGVRFKALVVVVSKENIDAHDLKDFAWYYRL